MGLQVRAKSFAHSAGAYEIAGAPSVPAAFCAVHGGMMTPLNSVI